MHRTNLLRPILAACLLSSPAFAGNASPPDLPGYHSTRDAITTTIRNAPKKTEGQSGYLGVSAEADAGRLIVKEVAPGSPAAGIGVREKDILLSVEGTPVKSPDELRAIIQSKSPGDSIALGIGRSGAKQTLTATLDALSKPPMQLNARAVLGVRMASASDRPGIDIIGVLTGKPAALAGLNNGDRIMKIDDAELGEARSLTDVMMEKRPGDSVKVIYRRANKLYQKTIPLIADDSETSTPPEERRELTVWKKPVFKLAVIGVDFPDSKHSPKVPIKEWEQAYFSRGTYTQKNATGQQVYGSMADYYQEISCGKLRIEGRAFDWVEVSKKRLDYNVSNKSKFKVDFMTEILDAVKKRDGQDALKDYDGIAFIYSGSKPNEVQRSSILWPHRASVKVGDRNWPYVIVPESSGNYTDGMHMANISTMCHEFGHILGLPDLYARPENPGSEGAGVWTLMSNQIRNGRPQHPDAWCKEQLGWLTPVLIDPTVKQKLILAPVENSDHECYKILVRPDGSEYFLLENRRKTGFDASLPAEGLLIWRIVANRPILEESHGVEGPAGPRVFLNSVPWPTKNNHSFTPYTTPSSRSQMGGGLPVNITNIHPLPDGRITFEIGYEFE